MGWLFTNKTQAQLVASLIQPESSDKANTHVLEHRLADNVLWSLVRLTVKEDGLLGLRAGDSTTFIRCDLLEPDGRGWGYKAMEEASFPYYFSCPLHYLDLAPEQSANWRANVRKFHADEAGKDVVRQLRRAGAI